MANGFTAPAAAAVLLSACAATGPAAPLAGGEWIVEEINGAGVIDDARPSLAFGEDGRVSGSGSCNRYGANYAVKGDRLKISATAATLMGCAEPVMIQERTLFALLEKNLAWRVDGDGALVLQSADGGSIRARR
jgi:putative lipoprotein